MTLAPIIRGAWSLYTRFFARFVLLVGVLYLALGLVGTVLADVARDAEGTGATLLAALVGVAISIVGTFLVQGLLVALTDDVRDGRADLSTAELVAQVRPVLLALIVGGLLAAVGIVIGFLLLIIPGLYLAVRFSLIPAAIVVERLRAGAAFSRSHELVRGHGRSVFGLLVVLFVISAIAGLLVGAVLSVALPDLVADWIGSAIANALITPFGAIALTLVYFRLAGDGEPESTDPDPPVPPG